MVIYILLDDKIVSTHDVPESFIEEMKLDLRGAKLLALREAIRLGDLQPSEALRVTFRSGDDDVSGH